MDVHSYQKLFRSNPLSKLKRAELKKDIVRVRSMPVIEDAVPMKFVNSITYHYRLSTVWGAGIEIGETFGGVKQRVL